MNDLGSDGRPGADSALNPHRWGVLVGGDEARSVIILGAGGHGRELLTFIAALPSERRPEIAVVDDNPDAGLRIAPLGGVYLGGFAEATTSRSPYLLGIGSGTVREDLARRTDEAGMSAATFVHPRSHVTPDARLGDGVVVFPNSTVTTNVTIGRHTHLNVGCAVQHDSVVGSFVQLSPGVLVNGDCSVGDHVFLGSGAIVTRGVAIGDGAEIGAGAVVLKDVPAGSRCVGVPGRNTVRPPGH